MADLTGKQLAQNIRQRIDELKKVCEGVDEGTSDRAPAGRWSPKEILSHLLGPEESPNLIHLQAFLDKDTPRLDIEPANPFLSVDRFNTRFVELLSQVVAEYERICRFAEGLNEEQLNRKARITMLKDTPYGEIQTLEAWLGMVGGMEGSHLEFHTNQMREILRELGVPGK